MNVLSSPRSALIDHRGAQKHPVFERLAMAFGVVTPFIGLLVAIWLLWGHGIGLIETVLLVAMYSFTILGVTVGFHRMFTHRAYEAGPVTRFILAVAGSMSAQGPLIEWCAMHRRRS